MSKLEFIMNNVNIDGVPDYATIIYPVGTELVWRDGRWRGYRPAHHPSGDIRPSVDIHIIVTGYSKCADAEGNSCNDCDGNRYVGSHGSTRCHFRKPSSRFGLCYWEKVNG